MAQKLLVLRSCGLISLIFLVKWSNLKYNYPPSSTLSFANLGFSFSDLRNSFLLSTIRSFKIEFTKFDEWTYYNFNIIFSYLSI